GYWWGAGSGGVLRFHERSGLGFVVNSTLLFGPLRTMPKEPSSRIRTQMFNLAPIQADGLAASKFCSTQEILRSIFYCLREWATQEESPAALSRAPEC
ncbi:MAG: hypothetical protein ACTH6V_13585, partial [Glutamicibacter arilaitensis]